MEEDIARRLGILTAAAKYDVSCASSGIGRGGERGSLGSAVSSGVCHSWTDDGRCVSLLKLLLTNDCVYDCAYCINRRSNDVPRASFAPREIAEVTVAFYKRNYIEGLFLSSAVRRSPDDTMVDLLRTIVLLRDEYRFNGYVHAKVIPGSSVELVEALGSVADRISVNVELPTEISLSLLAPQKNPAAIFGSMRFISGRIEEDKKPALMTWRRSGALAKRSAMSARSYFVPAGQSTQLIVGATPESDRTILLLSEAMYGRLGLKRVYYSAYMPVNRNAILPAPSTPPPLLREHRLYQADWLLRSYGYRADEILDETQQDLDEALDPKAAWALRHMDFFPINVNRADYEALLRVPGLGVKSAKRILAARRERRLRAEHLRRLGVVMKRAEHFIVCDGESGRSPSSAERLRALLTSPPPQRQLLLPFDPF